MRMTDRVLNASALSSGLAVNNVSLVNQLGKNRQDSLLDALEKGSSASTGKKENYSKLKRQNSLPKEPRNWPKKGKILFLREPRQAVTEKNSAKACRNLQRITMIR